MNVHEKRRAFQTLDGLRGIAAMLIVSRHIAQLAAGVSFPESYLAVDLFFLMSGFVIAFAYDERLKGDGFVSRFFSIRLIRLYPLYLAGLALGAADQIGYIVTGSGKSSLAYLIEAIAAGLILLPGGIGSVSGSALNSPTWTILPEIISNLIYSIFFRWMIKPILAAIVLAGAAGLIYSRYKHGTLDAGWSLEAIDVIASRLAFSFFGGVLIYRLAGDHRRERPVVAWACLFLAAVTLSVTPPERFNFAFEIGTVILVFPAIVTAAALSEPGIQSGKVFRFLGIASYAIYTLHRPVALLVIHAMQVSFHVDVAHYHIWPAVVFLLLITLIAWTADRIYDAPVRRWLIKTLLTNRHWQAKGL